MPVTTQLKLQALDRAASEALEDTLADYLEEVDTLFAEEVWGWPNTTKRVNGQLAGTIRDVIDTGQLADPSNRLAEVSSAGGHHEAEVTWLADYSAAVFLGAVFKRRALSLPARNVPQRALEALDIEGTFSKHLAKRLR